MAECPSVGPHPVIEQVMEEYGLTPEEIPEEVPPDEVSGDEFSGDEFSDDEVPDDEFSDDEVPDDEFSDNETIPDDVSDEVPDELTFDPKTFKNKSVLEKLRKKSKRYFYTIAFAEFDCRNCKRHWPSAQSVSIMDLKEQNICVLFDQECAKKKCKEINAEAEPVYDDDSIRFMAKYAVKKCLRLLYPDKNKSDPTRRDSSKKTSGAHHEDKCQACKTLGYNCGA